MAGGPSTRNCKGLAADKLSSHAESKSIKGARLRATDCRQTDQIKEGENGYRYIYIPNEMALHFSNRFNKIYFFLIKSWGNIIWPEDFIWNKLL